MSFYYPEHLPVCAQKQDITQAIASHQVTVLSGETGSGKTTQLPKICLELLGDEAKLIGCTQPRRIAALTVSSRVTEELGDRGYEVGCKIRFSDSTDDKTRIKFMTDGVLLAEIRSDPLLRAYGVLIIDEAHERSLNIDFLLGHLRNILPDRPDLKVIITSATIDTEAFAAHFGGAPVLHVAGTTYPVETRYVPPAADEFGEPESFIDACVSCTADILRNEGPGDILIFLPTEKDILNCVKLLQKKTHETEVMPLFGRLNTADQKKIFQPAKQTKIVVATNVAETSITVPGIRYVIDTGLARISYYNFRAKTNSLPVKKISRSSCDQRKGRCGRIGPGICFRLFDKEDYEQRDKFSTPEIKRSNLAEVILQMISFKLGDPSTFPFIDKPHKTAINDGYRLLKELGALNDNGALTKTGRIMASMPIDPCISRIIIEANDNGCLSEVTAIATVLAIQDPMVRPTGFEQQADAAHEAFAHGQSDFMTYLNIWNLYHEVKAKTSWSRLKKFCQTHYLSFQRMREWIDLHEQMKRIVMGHRQFTFREQEASYADIHKSLAAGFLRNIAQKKEGKIYQGASNKELMIFPGSHQFKKSAPWIMAASFLETNRLYALVVATIEPEWLEPIAGNLLSFNWTNPRYHKKSGQVVASERVTLFGLVLIASRQVNFGKTNAKNQQEARTIFIQEALVGGNLVGNYPFLKKNIALIDKWQELESRLRKRNLVAPELTIHAFYDNKLPQWVYDRPSLNTFLKKNKNHELLLREEDILQRRPENRELSQFPPSLTVGSHTFSLSYVFDPSDARDGVTVTIPQALLPAVSPTLFEWLVPGLLEEKITFLLKSLPKRIRKQLVPLSDTVERILDDSIIYRGSLFKAIEQSLFKQHKMTVHPSDFAIELPPHLQMRIALIDIIGKELCASRNLADLKFNTARPAKAPASAVLPEDRKIMQQWEERIITEWDFTGLPDTIPLRTPDGDIAGFYYPAITIRQEQPQLHLALRFMQDKEESTATTRSSLIMYLRDRNRTAFKSLKKYCTTALSGPSALWLINIFPSKGEAIEEILHYLSSTLFGIDELSDIPRSLTPQQKRVDLYNEGKKQLDKVFALLRLRREITSEIARYRELAKKTRSVNDNLFCEFEEQLESTLPQDFLKSRSHISLEDLERYLRGLAIRLQRAHADPAKDQRKKKPLVRFEHFMHEIKEKNEIHHEKLKAFEEMLQELRLSTFAPEIKTRFPVSVKKLEKLEIEIRHEW